jgi:hypothetical protein
VTQACHSLDDRIAEEILAEIGAARPDLGFILRIAIEGPRMTAEDAASLLSTEDRKLALGIMGQVFGRHGRMA